MEPQVLCQVMNSYGANERESAKCVERVSQYSLLDGLEPLVLNLTCHPEDRVDFTRTVKACKGCCTTQVSNGTYLVSAFPITESQGKIIKGCANRFLTETAAQDHPGRFPEQITLGERSEGSCSLPFDLASGR
jgi:hypothetical protein